MSAPSDFGREFLDAAAPLRASVGTNAGVAGWEYLHPDCWLGYPQPWVGVVPYPCECCFE